jgi:F-box/TPR repeat protein Pof3
VVHELLGNTKDALLDAKRVIEYAPQQWQGYYRLARLFLAIGKYQNAVKMVDCAIPRLPDTGDERKRELEGVRQQAVQRLDLARSYESRTTCHLARLPIELLTEVLDYLLAEDWTRVATFGLVCKHWRSVALTTPHFWNTLVLTPRNPVKKIRLWHERSNGRIKSLIIRPEAFESFPLEETLTDLRNALSGPIKMLDVPTPYFAFILEFVMPQLPDKLFGLEQLVIRAGLEGWHSSSHIDEFFDSARERRLQSLTFYDTPLPISMSYSPPCDTLRALSIYGFVAFRFADLNTMLRHSPLLERLILDLSPLAHVHLSDEMVTMQPLELPHLVHLELANIKGIVYNWLSAPNLRILRMDTLANFVSIAMPYITTDGECSLTEVQFRRCFWPLTASKFLLDACLHLEKLELNQLGNVDINDVVETLALPAEPGARPSLPSLKHLDFSNNAKLRTGPLIRLIKSRLPSPSTDGTGTSADPRASEVAPIQSLIVDGCDMIEADALPWFRRVVKVFSCVYMTKKQAKRTR